MENIRSKLIKNQDEFTETHKKIANLCKETYVELIELINPFDYYMY